MTFYDNEYDNETDRLADEIEDAEAEGRCLFNEDEECLVHHSYLNAPGQCLWAVQHADKDS